MDGNNYIPVTMYDTKKESSIDITLTFDQVYRDWMQKIQCFVKK